MKINKFKFLALGLAISAVSSAAMASSATLTTIDLPYAWQSLDVSDQGQISYIKNYSIGAPIRTRAYTWSAEDGETLLDEIPEQHYTAASSTDGSRIAVFTGESSGGITAPTHIYTDGVEQTISGSVFRSYSMSGDGLILGGMDASNQPSVMNIDTGVITPISIPNVSLINGTVRMISDNGQALYVTGVTTSNEYVNYLVDLARNAVTNIDLSPTAVSPDKTEGYVVHDMSGDGLTLAVKSGQMYNDWGAVCYGDCAQPKVWKWTPETGKQLLIPSAGFEAATSNYSGSLITGGKTIWDNVAGSRDLISALQAKGVDTSGWTAMTLNDISSNGKYLVGSGTKNGVYKKFLIENNAEPICTVPAF